MNDLKFAIRQLCKNPGFAVVAVLTLALGIGATTAIFSVMNAVIYRTLPIREPERLVLFGEGRGAGSTEGFPGGDTQLFTYPFYRLLLATNGSFEAVTALSSISESIPATVSGAAEQELVLAQLVSGTFFSTLGVPPAAGRLFTTADDLTPGDHPVAVISHRFWERRFGRNPDIVGRTVRHRFTTYTIVGVAAPEFFGISPGSSPDIWLPLSMQREVSPGWHGLENKRFQSLYVLGRLKDGVAPGQAGSEVNVLFQSYWKELLGQSPSETDLSSLSRAQVRLNSASTGISSLRRRYSASLRILLGVSALVLVIACANLAGLLLARSGARARELAVRMAIGAARTRLIRQMLTESALLAGVGSAVGLLLSVWLGRLLIRMASSGDSPLDIHVGLEPRVILFALLASVATTLLFGILPALRASGFELAPVLRDGRGVVSGGSRQPLGRALVVGQVALSLALLGGAGLLLRSLNKLASVPTGFEGKQVLVFGVDAVAAGYSQDEKLAALYDRLEERVNVTPGVKSSAFSFVTFNLGGWSEGVTSDVPDGGSGETSVTYFNVAGQGFFDAMRLPVLSGRAFTRHDMTNSPPVAVINETMARRFFPGGPAVGRRFGIGGRGNARQFEVIGVVKDAKYQTLDEKPTSMAYLPRSQRPGYLENLVVRFEGDPAAVARNVRQAFKETDSKLVLTGGETLAERVSRSIGRPRMIARLCSGFGFLAVLLSALGLYGLLSHAVVRRTNEIGVRMALGAVPSQVLGMILKEAFFLLGLGVVVGLPVTLVSGRWLREQLYDITPYDPVSLAIAVGVLSVVALSAGFLPARRAALVEPMAALRKD